MSKLKEPRVSKPREEKVGPAGYHWCSKKQPCREVAWLLGGGGDIHSLVSLSEDQQRSRVYRNKTRKAKEWSIGPIKEPVPASTLAMQQPYP